MKRRKQVLHYLFRRQIIPLVTSLYKRSFMLCVTVKKSSSLCGPELHKKGKMVKEESLSFYLYDAGIIAGAPSLKEFTHQIQKTMPDNSRYYQA